MNGLQEFALAVFKASVKPVPIGGFHEKIVRIKDLIGVLNDQLIPFAQISGKDQFDRFAVFLDPEFQDGRAQDVSRVSKAGPNAGLDIQSLITLNGVKAPKTCLGIGNGVEGIDLSPVLPLVFSALPFRIHLLNVGRIQEHDFTQLRRGRRGDDTTLKPVLDQFGNLAAVINVGVGQKEGLHPLWIKTPVLPVAPLHLPAALKKTAVDQDFFPLGAFNQIIGPGYRANTTQTCHANHSILLSE